MGSKDDHLLPSLPIQGDGWWSGGGEEQHRGIEGVCTSHLQNTRLWETIGKSCGEFPGKRADKCEHTDRRTEHENACSRTRLHCKATHTDGKQLLHTEIQRITLGCGGKDEIIVHLHAC